MCFSATHGQRGTVHEAANAAGVWKLPVVWLCENNGWAVSAQFKDTCSVGSIAERARPMACPVPSSTVRTRRLFRTWCAKPWRARSGGGPTLIEALTCRFRGHYEGDSHGNTATRPNSERLKLERDPLDMIVKRIRAALPDATHGSCDP
jgi:pyruvate dehydrogenase E1 component alpha subunit